MPRNSNPKTKPPIEATLNDDHKSTALDRAAQQGTHRQQRAAPPHALTNPAPQPQRPVLPLHAACLTIGVMFLRFARKPAAPDAWVCALAVMAIVPSTSTAAVKAIVSFLMEFSFAECQKNAPETAALYHAGMPLESPLEART